MLGGTAVAPGVGILLETQSQLRNKPLAEGPAAWVDPGGVPSAGFVLAPMLSRSGASEAKTPALRPPLPRIALDTSPADPAAALPFYRPAQECFWRASGLLCLVS
jgi:hypothetical protein